jgi:hypothetical protein
MIIIIIIVIPEDGLVGPKHMEEWNKLFSFKRNVLCVPCWLETNIRNISWGVKAAGE